MTLPPRPPHLPLPTQSWFSHLVRKRPWVREWLCFGVALAAYQLTRAIAIGGEDVALRHAQWIVDAERALGWFIEPAVQALFLPREGLVQVLNQIYVRAHLPVTILFFVWLYRRHRRDYGWYRNGFLVANALAVLVYIAFPVAPPRLMPELGILDTLRQSSGVDLYRGWRSHFFNQYAAVPSMHFGYSLLISAGVAHLGRRAWARLGALLYAPLILLIIVVTGNHFVLDAAAGAVVMVAGFACVWCAGVVNRQRAAQALGVPRIEGRESASEQP